MRESYNYKKASENRGITDRILLYHCSAGRLQGEKKTGNTWLVPGGAEKPDAGKYGSRKRKAGKHK